MRRHARHVAFTLSALALGCNPDKAEGPRSSFTADEAAQMRAACAFGPGTLPGLSIGKDEPLGSEIPIENIVVLMMENRSFDHLLSMLPAAGQSDVEVAAADATNPDDDGTPVGRYHDQEYCFADVNHEWSGAHEEWNGGANDGFVKANNPNGRRALSYYDQSDLPFLYWLATTWSLSDHNFASLLGPTFPNREYLYAATSYGRTVNDIFSDGMRPTLFTAMEDVNATRAEKDQITWRDYYESLPAPAIFLDTFSAYFDHVATSTDFLLDAAAGTLPQVTFLDPDLSNEDGGGNDFHPPGDVQVPDAYLYKIVDALTHSPQWPHLALIITFDEHGGFYDHVPPPKACAPDDNAPIVGDGETQYDFTTYGFRVPLIVVSPYAKPHYVSHRVTDHTSITRFIETRFGVPALTKRDANAEPLYDLFDFKHAAFATPPPTSAPVVDQAKLTACQEQFPRENNNPNTIDMAQPEPTDGGAPDADTPDAQ